MNGVVGIEERGKLLDSDSEIEQGRNPSHPQEKQDEVF